VAKSQTISKEGELGKSVNRAGREKGFKKRRIRKKFPENVCVKHSRRGERKWAIDSYGEYRAVKQRRTVEGLKPREDFSKAEAVVMGGGMGRGSSTALQMYLWATRAYISGRGQKMGLGTPG